VLESTDPAVSVRELLEERGIETLRDYRLRSRRQINEIRSSGGVIPGPKEFRPDQTLV